MDSAEVKPEDPDPDPTAQALADVQLIQDRMRVRGRIIDRLNEDIGELALLQRKDTDHIAYILDALRGAARGE